MTDRETSELSSDSNDGSDAQLIGYVCSTLSRDESITHASMSEHIPEGRSVCVHSVCVDKRYRRRGVALRLLKEYTSRLQTNNFYDRVLLIAHEELVVLYKKAGFMFIGRSPVTHGPRPWFEMRLRLRGDSISEVQQLKASAGILEALRASSSQHREEPRRLASFERGIDKLIDATKMNNQDLLCPRCSSTVLLKGVAHLVERPSVQMDSPNNSLHPLLPALPKPPDSMGWWLVSPSPMQFENIVFSKPVGNASSGGRPMKLLACAECDLGPLGWCEEGGKEFWLSPARMGYRTADSEVVQEWQE